jgi:hypothetical protein
MARGATRNGFLVAPRHGEGQRLGHRGMDWWCAPKGCKVSVYTLAAGEIRAWTAAPYDGGWARSAENCRGGSPSTWARAA